MLKPIRKPAAWLVLLAASLFSACLKDTGNLHYKLYIPVYENADKVRAAIKNDIPQPVSNAGKMCIQGNTIYLVELEKGIHVIDNTNPASPVNKAFIRIPGNEDIAVEGNMLYADCYSDLMAIDISNLSNIKLKTYIPGIFPDRKLINGVYLSDPTKIPTGWIVKDTSVTVKLTEGQGIWTTSGFLTPRFLYDPMLLYSSYASSSYSAPTTGVVGSMAKMAITGKHLYTVSQNLLNAISIADPASPSYLTNRNLHLGIGAAETIFPFKDKLFIGSTSGMYIFSIADPDKPVQLSTFSHATVCDPVITDGIHAFITLRSGTGCGGIDNELQVVNVQDVLRPSFIKKYLLSSPRGLCKDGNTLFVCDAIDGLKIFDATDVNNLVLKQTVPVGSAYDVISLNNILYVTTKEGLHQFDYSDLSNIKKLSTLSLTQ